MRFASINESIASTDKPLHIQTLAARKKSRTRTDHGSSLAKQNEEESDVILTARTRPTQSNTPSCNIKASMLPHAP
jgi:hypothetical protein